MRVSKNIIVEFDKYKDLPFPIYVSNFEGDILLLNNSAENLFGISNESDPVHNINNYYALSRDREVIVENLIKSSNKWEEDIIATFNIRDVSITTSIKSKKLINSDSGETVFMCIAVLIDGLSKFKDFEDSFTAGLFELTDDNKLTYSNKSFNETLGVESSDIPDIDIIKFIYVEVDKKISPNDKYQKQKLFYTELVKELQNVGFIKDRSIVIERKDKSTIVVKLNLGVEQYMDGLVYKVKGIIEDITYDSIDDNLDKLNIGLFSVDRVNESLIVSQYNSAFKNLFKIGDFEKSSSSLIGRKFSDLFTESQYKKIHTRFDQAGDEFIDMNIRSLPSSTQSIELNIRFRRIIQKPIEKYVGAVYVNSDEVEKSMRDLRADYSSFLHSYSAMANNIRITLNNIILAHGTDVVKNEIIDKDLALEYVKYHISGFETHLKRFYKEITLKGLDSIDESLIQWHVNSIMNKINKYELDETSASSIRNNFQRIRVYFNDFIHIGLISKELIKSIDYEITQILRFARLISLNFLEEEAFSMGFEIQEIKEVIRSRNVIPENKEFNLLDSLTNAYKYLIELAEKRQVKIRRKYKSSTTLKVIGDKRNLFTAFYNVINNAIKYSYRKSADNQAIVIIDVKELYTSYHISIENRGAGIPQSEIRSRSIFDYSYRGLSSDDRVIKKGHGIGLWHCEQIVKQFGGKIEAKSVPVGYKFSKNKFVDIENTPHITTFTIILPKP